ncbi:hypothetical protein D3C84_1284690 [compost metagenome]
MANREESWCECTLPAFRNYDGWCIDQVGRHCRYDGEFESTAPGTSFSIYTAFKLDGVWQCRERYFEALLL